MGKEKIKEIKDCSDYRKKDGWCIRLQDFCKSIRVCIYKSTWSQSSFMWNNYSD